jgi:hypothetical protein
MGIDQRLDEGKCNFIWANRKEPFSGHQRGRLIMRDKEKKWQGAGKIKRSFVPGEDYPFCHDVNKGLP